MLDIIQVNMQPTEKVLVVGGGFGGVKAALELSSDSHFDITLISDDTDLKYYPTLYKTATGKSKANSSIPLKNIFQGTRVKIVKDKVLTLDRKQKKVTTETKAKYEYDVLILALGVVTNYFGIEGLDQFSYGIKSEPEIARFKQHLHRQISDEHKPDLNYIIVGAGPTGIELAGALPEYIKHIMKNHQVPERKIHIDLIEAMPRLLPNLPTGTSNHVRRRLNRLGVRLYLNSKVEGQTADELMVSGRPIKSHTVIWTAGVTNNPFFGQNDFVMMGRGKVGVDVYLQAEPNIFVLGDNANTPYSGLAQTAIHDGSFVAYNLKRRAAGKDFKSYVAKKPITVIPAGPHWAVVLWGKFAFSGWTGYLIREAADLIGFHDLEKWPSAIKQYISEFTEQDDCKVCTLAANNQS